MNEELRHIDRIIWKPINWLREGPEQYPDGLPIAKPEGVFIEMKTGGTSLFVEGYPLSPELFVSLGVIANESSAGNSIPFKPIGRIPTARICAVFDRLMQVYRIASRDSSPSMRHVDRIVWKSQEDPAPEHSEPNSFVIIMPDTEDSDGTADALYIAEENENEVAISWTQAFNDWDEGQVTDDNAEELTTAESPRISVPILQVPELADALLYVHRRTHEHDYEGPDAGLR
jgi:hypothetical protein